MDYEAKLEGLTQNSGQKTKRIEFSCEKWKLRTMWPRIDYEAKMEGLTHKTTVHTELNFLDRNENEFWSDQLWAGTEGPLFMPPSGLWTHEFTTKKGIFFGENREYKINVWYINTAELATGNGQQKENTEKRPEFADAQWGTEGLTLVESIKRIESYAENRGGQW